MEEIILEDTLEETIVKLTAEIEISNKVLLEKLIRKNLKLSKDSNLSTYAIHPNVIFHFREFLIGLHPLLKEYDRNSDYSMAAEAFCKVCEGIGIELDKEEAFILYHLKDLGKFRKREDEIYKQLIKKWQVYNEYKLEENDFSHALKALMRLDFLGYRRRNVTITDQIIIRYRTEKYKQK